MVQRIALFVASLAAVGVLVVGLAVAGVGPAGAGPGRVQRGLHGGRSGADAAGPDRHRVCRAAARSPRPSSVHKTVAPAGGEHETESEGEGD